MQKRIAALILSLALALTLTLAACEAESRARPSSDAPEPSSRLIRSEAPAEPESSAPDLPQAEDALVREIIKTYGAEETDDGAGGTRLKTKMVSLLFDETGWEDPEELPCVQYFGWFLSTTFDEDYQYKLAHYIHPEIGEGQGWFFPREVYEERIQRYFAVSTDHLRSDPDCYSPELGGYWMGGGGGRGEEPFVDYSYTQEGDLLTIELELRARSTDGPAARRVLTVRLEPEGGWKYTGCRAADPR